MAEEHAKYYVPEQSAWPIYSAASIGVFVFGLVHFIRGETIGPFIFGIGLIAILATMVGWFRDVIHESHQGLYSDQMDRSFRLGMLWFIFSEVMFFAAFFGALFYVRQIALPWLGGLSDAKIGTNTFLWPEFQATWPLLINPNPELFKGPKAVIDAMGLPLLNTALLLTSSVTVTIAHWALKWNNRGLLNIGLAATIALGATFLYFQGVEYIEAYEHLGLTLGSGIYGSTFFMLTGFHGMHVTLGTIMLTVIFFRCLKGHFTKENHFGFEAVSWYWHFVDVVWVFLFLFVYLL